MERKQFLKACLVGMSSCAACGVAGLAGAADEAAAAGQDAAAAGQEAAAAGQEAAAAGRTVDAMRVRYAALVGAIGRHVSEETQRTIFRDLGRECARQFKAMTFEKFAGNIDGFLAEARGPNGWMTGADYDRKSGVITIVDRAKSCTCPLVKPALTPAAQCECTLGWQEETYSRILGRPVKASLVESILRGGTRCVFRVETT